MNVFRYWLHGDHTWSRDWWILGGHILAALAIYGFVMVLVFGDESEWANPLPLILTLLAVPPMMFALAFDVMDHAADASGLPERDPPSARA